MQSEPLSSLSADYIVKFWQIQICRLSSPPFDFISSTKVQKDRTWERCQQDVQYSPSSVALDVENSGHGLILFESFHEKSIAILARYSSFFSTTSSRTFVILVGITGTHKGHCYLFNHKERKDSRVQFPIHSQFST